MRLSAIFLLLTIGCGGSSKGGLSSLPDGGAPTPSEDATPGSRAPVEASVSGLDDDAGSDGPSDMASVGPVADAAISAEPDAMVSPDLPFSPDAPLPGQTPDASTPTQKASFSPSDQSIQGTGSPSVRFTLSNTGGLRIAPIKFDLSEDPFPLGPAKPPGVTVLVDPTDPEQCRDGNPLSPAASCHVDLRYTVTGTRPARKIRLWIIGDSGPLTSAVLNIGPTGQ